MKNVPLLWLLCLAALSSYETMSAIGSSEEEKTIQSFLKGELTLDPKCPKDITTLSGHLPKDFSPCYYMAKAQFFPNFNNEGTPEQRRIRVRYLATLAIRAAGGLGISVAAQQTPSSNTELGNIVTGLQKDKYSEYETILHEQALNKALQARQSSPETCNTL